MKSVSLPSLPTNRAFVVQLYDEDDVAQGKLKGRVEHVASMQAVHFHSQEELIAFLIQTVASLEDTEEET
jgi:hypothetical protein